MSDLTKLQALVEAIAALSTAVNTAINTRQAPDSLKLAGKTLQEVIDQAAAGTDLSDYTKKTDDFGAYNVTWNSTTQTLAAALTGLKGSLDAFIANKATAEDATTGTDDSKYITALSLKAATDKAIADLVDGAPTALDTLKELADALANDQDAIAAITLALDNKLGKTEQAADSALLGGSTKQEIIDAVTSDLRGPGTGGGLNLALGLARPTLDQVNLYDAATNPDSLNFSYEPADDDTLYWMLNATYNNVRGLAWNLTGLTEGQGVRIRIDGITSGGPNNNYVGFTANPAATSPTSANWSNVSQGNTYTFAFSAAAPYFMVRGDYPNYDLTNLDALIEVETSPDTWVNLFTLAGSGGTPNTDTLSSLRADLDGKLGKQEQAADSAKFDGKTYADAKADILSDIPASTALVDFTQDPYRAFVQDISWNWATIPTGVYTGEIPDLSAVWPEIPGLTGNESGVMTVWIVPSKKLPGGVEVSRKVQILGNASADGVSNVTLYHYGSYASNGGGSMRPSWGTMATQDFVNTAVAAANSELVDRFIDGGDADETLKTLRDAIDGFIAKKASSAEAIAGTDDEKYITALALKAKVDDAINALVNGAPEAYDTLKELADALADQDDALAALVTQLGQKLGKTEQAADSAKLGGKTQADLTASDVETQTGTETAKFVTPAGLKSVTDTLATSAELEEVVDSMTQALNDAIDALNNDPV